MRTGSIGIVSLTNSAKSKIDLLPNNYPVVKVRPDCSGYVPGPACAGSGSSSDPLVGELDFEITDQGLDGGGHTKTARGPASEPSWDSACATRSSRGPPGLFNSVVVWPRAGQNLRSRPEKVVETRRLELLTSSLQRRCSTN